jgi:predicted dehydrogenase
VDQLWQLAGQLDLVVIAAPPAAHVPLAHAALDHGLAVVVDKPLAVSAAQARDLVDRAEALDVPLTVFQNRRWDGDFLTVRRLITDGALGDVRRLESRFEWWKPEEGKRWKARATPAEGGGILFDLGAHLVDQAVQLFGPVEDVHAELAQHRAGVGAEDDAFVSLLHTSGTRSQLWMNAMAAQAGPRFHILGSTSGYTTWGLDGQEAALKRGALPTDEGFGVAPESTWGVVGRDGSLEHIPTERGDYAAFYDRLARSLLDGAPLPVDPRDAVDVIALIEQIHRTAARR